MKCKMLFVLIFFVCACSPDPTILLQEGIEEQDKEKVNAALQTLPTRTVVFNNGETPLGKALKTDNKTIVEMLLDAGFLLQREILPPLLQAKSAEMVAFLLDKGGLVDAQDSLGNTLLHLSQKQEIVKVLLEKGSSVNKQNRRGETPLMKAAALGDRDIFLLLLSHGADSTLRDNQGQKALAHTLPNSGVAAYWEEERKRAAAQKKKAEEERQRKERLQKQFPAKGKTGYICNHGTLCQVLIREVAGSKVKIEVLEKCWPRNMNMVNLSKALDAGNVLWLEKYRVYSDTKRCP